VSLTDSFNSTSPGSFKGIGVNHHLTVIEIKVEDFNRMSENINVACSTLHVEFRVLPTVLVWPPPISSIVTGPIEIDAAGVDSATTRNHPCVWLQKASPREMYDSERPEAYEANVELLEDKNIETLREVMTDLQVT